MIYAIIARTGDILQAIGLVVVVGASVWTSLKVAKYGRAALAYFKR